MGQMKVVRERGELWLSINLKNEVKVSEMEKSIRQAGLEKDPELSSRDVKFTIFIRHPSRDAK